MTAIQTPPLETTAFDPDNAFHHHKNIQPG